MPCVEMGKAVGPFAARARAANKSNPASKAAAFAHERTGTAAEAAAPRAERSETEALRGKTVPSCGDQSREPRVSGRYSPPYMELLGSRTRLPLTAPQRSGFATSRMLLPRVS